MEVTDATKHRASLRRHSAGQAGFTIVEVMVAMIILVVGMLGVATMLSQASQTTSANKAREQAVALARELTESARSQAYVNLVPSSIVALVQADAALKDASSAAGWQIVRRGITFNVAMGVCSVDDPNDGTGTHDATTFCANGAGNTSSATCQAAYGAGGDIAGNGTLTGAAGGDCGLDANHDGRVDGLTEAESGACPASICPAPAPGSTPDKNPDDFKRIVVLLRWNRGPGTKYVLQDTTIPYPGVTAAPNVTALVSTPDNAQPITSPDQTQIQFDATTSKPAATLSWYVQGSPMDPAATSITPTHWRFFWDLKSVGSSAPNPGQVLDGDYLVEARAFDRFGQYGTTRPIGISLNRRAPYPVIGFRAVQVGNDVEIVWGLSPERDVIAYQVRRSDLASPICAPALVTSCKDLAPPSSGNLDYWANALDRDPSGVQRAGDDSVKVTIPRPNAAPSAPSGLVATATGGNAVKLTWVASPGDSDGTINGYAIFRDSTSIGDWYATVDGATTTWTDPNGLGHTYWVAAIDDKNAQSLKSNGASG